MNRSILSSGWGMFVERLGDKALGRVEKVNPAYTSQTCFACKLVDARNRKSQAFRCIGCGHQDHADVNAAKNIAAGRAVRGAENVSALKRVPQTICPSGEEVELLTHPREEDVNMRRGVLA